MTFELIIGSIAVPVLIAIIIWIITRLYNLKGATSRINAEIKDVKEDLSFVKKDIRSVECANSNLETRIKLFIDDRDKSILLKFDRTDAKIDDLKNSLHSISESLAVLRTNSENSAKSNSELSKILVKVDKEFEAAKTDIAVLNERVETIRRST